MRTYLLSFVATAVLAAVFTPIVRIAAMRIGAVSTPGGRNINARSVPRLGGIAIALATACTLSMLLRLESGVGFNVQQEPRLVLGLLCGALMVFAVGVLDDTRRVRALYKLVVQIAAASVAFGCGFRIDAVSPFPFGGALSMGHLQPPDHGPVGSSAWSTRSTSSTGWTASLRASLSSRASRTSWSRTSAGNAFLAVVMASACWAPSSGSCSSTSTRRASSWATRGAGRFFSASSHRHHVDRAVSQGVDDGRAARADAVARRPHLRHPVHDRSPPSSSAGRSSRPIAATSIIG